MFQVVHTYEGHQADVHLLLPFGDHLISVDKQNAVIIWDVESEGLNRLFLDCIILVKLLNHCPHHVTVLIYIYINLTHEPMVLFFSFSDVYLQISFDKSTFEVRAVMHPSTYLNKILFGSSQGSLQLWNVKSKYAIFTTL